MKIYKKIDLAEKEHTKVKDTLSSYIFHIAINLKGIRIKTFTKLITILMMVSYGHLIRK